MACEFPVVVKS